MKKKEGSELTPDRDCAAVADFCDAGGKDSAAAGGVRGGIESVAAAPDPEAAARTASPLAGAGAKPEATPACEDAFWHNKHRKS